MLADAVASAVLRRYASLPKNGKPQPGEYTLLAGFVVTEDAVPDAPPRVVALGTGTKCLPASSRCPRGEALSDSHAEVIARRAFVRFLYDELERAMEDDGDALRDAGVARDETNENAASPKPIVEWVAGESTMAPFRLRDGVRVHLYATQSPCGDASIFELANERSAARAARVDGETSREASAPEERDARSKELALLAPSSVAAHATNKRAKTSSGGPGASFAGATGAKRLVRVAKGADAPFGRLCVDNECGAGLQAVGACRLKPGRGARTDCMSCSDKIARWVALGVQGALPSSLLARKENTTTTATTTTDTDTRVSSSGAKTPFGYGAVRLTSVVVSSPLEDTAAATRRNVLAALRRAVVDRVGFAVAARDAPEVCVAPPAPPELSSAAGQTRGWTASGTSVNWHWSDRRTRGVQTGSESFLGTEVTLGATGRRAGFSKKARGSRKAQSRLCRASLAARYGEVAAAVERRRRRAETDRPSATGGTKERGGGDDGDDDGGGGGDRDTALMSCLTSRDASYGTLKRLRAGAYIARDASFRTPPSPFAQWSVKDPRGGRLFEAFPPGSFKP